MLTENCLIFFLETFRNSMEAEMQSILQTCTLPFVVHCLQPVNAPLESIPLQTVTKLCSDTPVLVIAHTKGMVKARCCVPKVSYLSLT